MGGTLIVKKLQPKIRKISALEQKGSGPEPTWEDLGKLKRDEYLARTARAINWYYTHYTKKEGQEWCEAWFHNHCFRHPEEIKAIATARQDNLSNLLCFIYAMEQRGWVARHCILRKIRADLQVVMAAHRARSQVVEDDEDDEEDDGLPKQTVAERVRDQAGAMSEEIDGLIDRWMENPSAFDPKNVKVIALLRSKHVKGAHARHIKAFYTRAHAEVAEAVGPSPHDQIKESYKHIPKKDIRKLVEFYDAVFAACDQLIEESKILRKPRAKKTRSNEELLKNFKYMARDDANKLVSVPPTTIIGASAVVVFNSRTRKIGLYTSAGPAGISVKGSTLTNVLETNTQRSVRKPTEQLKSLKDQNTIRKFENWYKKELSTIETPLTGRITEDTLILKVYK